MGLSIFQINVFYDGYYLLPFWGCVPAKCLKGKQGKWLDFQIWGQMVHD
jgi:hypothetical protein